MLSIDVLTQEEMKANDQRQARQQLEWKAIPQGGCVVSFLGVELVELPGVFPPKEDTLLIDTAMKRLSLASLLLRRVTQGGTMSLRYLSSPKAMYDSALKPTPQYTGA